MSTSTLGLFLRHLALSEEVNRLGSASDHDLLSAHESGRGQAAFAELMRRHGPMVLRTCRRVLGRGPDAEDAFQATFVLLARKVAQLRRETAGRLSLGGWLHRVAYRTALNVLTGAARRRVHERQASAMTHSDPDPSTEATWNEIRPILDAELDALPEPARQLLIACYLQAKTHAEAAAELGLPPGSLARRLERARALLATRLARRGVTVSAGLLAALLGDLANGSGVPAVLLVHTLETAMTFSEQATGAITAHVAHLVKGALANMTSSSIKFSLVLACCLGLVGAGVVVCRALSARPDEPAAAGPAAAQAHDQPEPGGRVAARVDCYGDPLPAGALARMGTVRQWYGRLDFNPAHVLAFSPDDKTLVSRTRGDGFVCFCFWDAATGKEIRRINDCDNTSLALSPDGKLLAKGKNETLFLWEVATGKLLHKLRFQGPKRKRAGFLGITFLPNGKILTLDGAGIRDYRFDLWDVATGGREISQLVGGSKDKSINNSETLAFSRNGKMMAATEGAEHIIHVWEVATGKKIHQLQLPGKENRSVYSVAFSPDDKTLAAGGEQICVWEVATGKPIYRFKSGGTGFSCPLAYSPDGKTLFGGAEGHLWDMATGKEIRLFGWENAKVAVFSSSGKIVAVGDKAGVIRLWEVATGKEILPHKGFQDRVNSITYSPDGKTLASLSDDKAVRLWEVATGKEIRQLAKHTNWGIGSLAYSPDGKMLASMDDVIHLWDTATGKEIRQLQGGRQIPDGGVRQFGWEIPQSVTFSPDSKLLAAGGGSDTVCLWQVATGKQIYTLSTEHRGFQGWSVAFSPDGRMLAVPDKDGTVSLWEVTTGKSVGHLGELKQRKERGQSINVISLAFSADGRMLTTSSKGDGEDNKIHVWEVASGKEIRHWQAEAECSPTFSPDRRILATIGLEDKGKGKKIYLWEMASGKEIGQPTGHQASVRTIAFSPDGKTMASGSDDLTCLVWDVTSFAGQLKPVTAPPPALGLLSKEQLEAAWADLAKDPAQAYAAVRALQAVSAQAIPLLRERVRPVAPVADLKQLQRWIADLDDNNFTVRDKAQRKIEKLGEVAVPALRQALKGQPVLEVKRRLQALLAELEPKMVGGSPNRLRELRTVQVLESVGTAEARQLLQALAKGVSGARLTVEAEAALARLAKRPAAKP